MRLIAVVWDGEILSMYIVTLFALASCVDRKSMDSVVFIGRGAVSIISASSSRVVIVWVGPWSNFSVVSSSTSKVLTTYVFFFVATKDIYLCD